MKPGLTDVFWLQERWKVYAGLHTTFTQWLDGDTRVSEKRHRILLWLADAPSDWQVPSGWIHPDADYEAFLTEGADPPGWLPQPARIVNIRPDTPLLEEIRTLDRSADLPFDFIITARTSPSLFKAARRLAIPVISLP